MTPNLIQTYDLMNMLGQSTDQGYSSGQQYAQSIAGGENVPGMIAPGVSYSMERPEGYTQSPILQCWASTSYAKRTELKAIH